MHSDKRKCLSEFEIGAYIEGRLSSEEKHALDNHLALCKRCWEDFVAINRAVMHKGHEAGDAPEHLIKKVIGMYPEKKGLFDIVLSLVRDMIRIDFSSDGINIFNPVPAGSLRSDMNSHPEMVILKKSFEDLDVELDIEKVGGDQCNIRVAVDNIKAKALMNALRVELIAEGRELVSDLIEDGEAIIEDISIGKYVIKIHQKGKVFGKIALKIK